MTARLADVSDEHDTTDEHTAEAPVLICYNAGDPYYPDPIEESSEQVAHLLDQIDQMSARLDELAAKIDQLVETYKQADAEQRVEAALDRQYTLHSTGRATDDIRHTATLLDDLPNETVILAHADMTAYQKADDDTWYATGIDRYVTDAQIACEGTVTVLYEPQETA